MAVFKKRLTNSGAVRWDAQVYVGRNPTTRKPQFLSKTFQREKDAQAWAREQERMKDQGSRPATTKESFAEYLTHWLKVHAGQVRAVTIYNYTKTLNRWLLNPTNGCPPIGSFRLSQLSVTAFDNLYAYMREQGMGPRGVQYLHGILKRALNDAVRKGTLPKNPAQYATPPKQQHSSDEDDVVNAMNQEQAARFLAAANSDRYAALWYVLLLGMLRPCEAFALKWDDVDFNAGSVRVRQSLTRIGIDKARTPEGWKLTPPKTKRSKRTVPLPRVAMQQLKAWQSQQKRERLQFGVEYKLTGFVFTTELGTPLDLSNLYRGPFRRIMRDAGLGVCGPAPAKPKSGPTAKPTFSPAFRIYDLRHTGATLLLLAGESLKVVSERLGHSTIVLTADTYSHVLPTMQRGAADKLEAMFG